MKVRKKDIVILTIGLIFVMTLHYAMAKQTRRTRIEIDKDNPVVSSQFEIQNDDFKFGNNKAPVKIVFYGDFACHHCIGFMRKNFQKIVKKYILTNKAQFIFRPMISTRATLFGSKMLLCKDYTNDEKINILYNMFKNNWVFKNDYANALLKLFREEKWLSDEEFIQCEKSKKLEMLIINKHKHTISNLKITSTPAVFVNYKNVKADENVFNEIEKSYQELENK